MDRSPGKPSRGSPAVLRRSIIGWIKPDDGERQDGRLLDYECFRLEEWLHRNGIDDLGVDVELSPAEPHHTPEDLMATGSLDRLVPAARRLSQRGCSLVAWVCTSGSFVGGRTWAETQAGALSREGGVPATSTSLAIVEALLSLDATDIDVLSPYPPPLTERLLGFLREFGIGVSHFHTCDCPTGGSSHRLDLRESLRRFVAGRAPAKRAILIPDTAINSLELGAELEEIAGRTVVTANQATLWQIARMLKHTLQLPHIGTLLSGHARSV